MTLRGIDEFKIRKVVFHVKTSFYFGGFYYNRFPNGFQFPKFMKYKRMFCGIYPYKKETDSILSVSASLFCEQARNLRHYFWENDAFTVQMQKRGKYPALFLRIPLVLLCCFLDFRKVFLDAVSYTHLDVYKRQVWLRGGSR